MPEETENFFKKNKFKIGFLILSLIIAFSVFYYFTIYPRQQRQQMNNADSQKKCDEQAKKVLNSIRGKVNNINYTYKNHYIGSLNRCYVLIHGIGVGETGISDRLIDAYGNKDIADCESYATAPELDFCSYNGSSEMAYNINQFNDFIKPYMETK
jgi:hypothetical protein